MNLEKVIFGAFVILSCTLNFGFFIGDITDPEQHHSFELGATIVVNLIAMTLKFGDRTHIGAVHLATSIVAVLQLIAAAVVWIWATRVSGLPSEFSDVFGFGSILGVSVPILVTLLCVIGMTILTGLKSDGDNVYGGGTILDPANGKTYNAKVTVIEGGRKLEMRGSILFIGRTQTWVRAE